MKKVIISGATGFIGYHLLRELREKGVEVWALCRPDNKDIDQMKKLDHVHVAACGLEQIRQLPELCEEREFDAFYHLAWKGASGSARGSYRTQLDNVRWTCDCVETAREMRCGKVIISGTVCEKQCDAVLKQSTPSASAYYLLAKKYAGEMAGTVGNRIGIPVLECQFYHPVGAFNKKEQIIASTIQKLRNNEAPQYGSAEGLFDVMDVRDLSHALYLMGERELDGDTYFVGSGKPRMLKAYLETVKDMVNPSAQMGYGAIDTHDLPMKKEWLDISPFQTETGFAPVYTFPESIREMLCWLEDEKAYDSKKWLV